MKKTIITIGRQFGSGGREIGKILAHDLGVKLYDKALLKRASEESGLNESFFEMHDEKPTNSFLYSLVMDSYQYNMPMEQKVFLAQFDAIKKIAEDGPCVLVGRCADYALEGNPNVINVFVHADMESRVQRIARIHDLSNSKAKELILKTDKKRANYYNYHTGKVWGTAHSYDLCINSSKLGLQGSVDLIKKYVDIKESKS